MKRTIFSILPIQTGERTVYPFGILQDLLISLEKYLLAIKNSNLFRQKRRILYKFHVIVI
jgi:hypothetical protein